MVGKSKQTPLQSGSKLTEIGIFPNDWDIINLDDNGSFKKGKGIKKDDVADSGFPCIRYGEIYTRHDDFVREFFSFIPLNITKQSQRIKKGDLLFAGSGETIDDIGKCIAFLGKEEAYAGGDIVIYSPIRGNSLFLGYLMNYELIKQQKAKMGQGIGVVHIYSSNLKKIILPFPKPQEQSKIAQILFETDSLIESLHKLLIKKKNIKKGMIHELLTGKRKLSRFIEKWEIKELGEIVKIKKGQLITQHTSVDGNIPVIGGGKNSSYFHNRSNRFQKTITISASGANAGYVSFHDNPIFASDCSTIEDGKNYSIEYVYFQLQRLQNKIYSLQAGGAQPHVHASDLDPLEIPFPKNQKEQIMIAEIFSDMEKEIQELEKEKDKYLKINTGMMQKLLTGEIRLK